MPWLRVEDTCHSHDRVVAAGRGGDDRQVNEVLGWLIRCASWSAEHLTDGWISEELARQFAGSANYDRVLLAARQAKLVTRRRRRPAGAGPGVEIESGEDAPVHIRTREEVELDRGRRGSTRQQEARAQVRARDGDQCRYCQRWVDFAMRRGGHRGTYDHPDPADRDTFVVSCGACNQTKGKRTPDQARMTLHPPPAPEARHFTDETHQWLAGIGLLHPRPGHTPDPAPASSTGGPLRPGNQPDTAAPLRSGNQPDTAAPARPTGSTPADTAPSRSTPHDRSAVPGSAASAVPVLPVPGRDGTGSGSGTAGPPPAAARPRDGPRRRRARRGAQSRTSPLDP